MPLIGAVDPAFQAEQLRMHRCVLAGSVGVSALAGLLLAALLWGAVENATLLGWLAALALALLLFGVITVVSALRAQAMLREAASLQPVQHDYELVTNSMTDMVSVVGEDQVYRLVNDEWCRRFGLARAAVVGRRTDEVLPTVATEERQRALRECIESKQRRVVRGTADFPGLAGGHFETTYYPHVDEAAGIRCVVMVSRDVTEQEQSRRQLAAGAEYLRRTLNATGDAIFATDAADPNEPVRFANVQMLQMWGIPLEKLDSLTPADIDAFTARLLVDPDAEMRRIDEIVASNAPHEARLRLRDGRVLLRRCIPAQVGGRTLRVWSFRDITAEEARLSVEGELRTMLEVFPGYVARASEDFRYVDANERFAALFGLKREELIGRHSRDLLGAQHFEELRKRRAQLVSTGQPLTFERSIQPRTGGARIELLVTHFMVKPAYPGDAPKFYQFAFDISDRKRAEAQLRDTSEQLARKTQELQDTLDSISQGIVSIDAAGRTTVYNRRALELLELPEALLASHASYDDVVRLQIQRGDLAADGSFLDAEGQRRHFNGGRANAPEVYVRKTRTGALLEVRTRKLPGGGFVRTFADVTTQVRAQQALHDREAEQRALLDAFPGFITCVDANRVYTYANQRVAQRLGITPQDMVGRTVREVVGEKRAARLGPFFERALAGEQVTYERAYKVGSANLFFDHVTLATGVDSRTGGVVIYTFGIDISDRKRAEDALIAARDEAERANRAKSEFLSRMSHELRTPLNAILGFGQLLEIDPRIAGKEHDWVLEIGKGGRHLLELINEVLDLARVESGQFSVSLEPVALLPLVQECLAMLRPQAQARHIALPEAARRCDVQVQADRTRLKQVLLNLLSNAIKYNREAGSVGIGCEADEGGVRIQIDDSGAGLTPEQQARLFVPFERLDADQKHIEGTGIGLALSKRLVELMGGQIGVDSQPGQGSRFWVRLPAAQGWSEHAPSLHATLDDVASAGGEGERTKVLCIEDNPANLRLIEGLLALRPDIHLLTAAAPGLGLELARAHRPALILLDINLPDMDGYAVLRCLRENETTRDIPVLAVSANAMPKDLERGKAAGFVDYLTKPIGIQRFLAVVDRVLATRLGR